LRPRTFVELKASRWGVDAKSLGIIGSTQPEIFKGTVDALAQLLLIDAARFWQEAMARDGPIEIWVIGGNRYIHNGNHRFQAALQAGVEIPPEVVVIVDKTGSQVPTFLLHNLTWVPGLK
jgi:hypothetical protein